MTFLGAVYLSILIPRNIVTIFSNVTRRYEMGVIIMVTFFPQSWMRIRGCRLAWPIGVPESYFISFKVEINSAALIFLSWSQIAFG